MANFRGIKFLWQRVTVFLAAITFFLAMVWHARTHAATPADAKRSVVVELFTSEGCSSCPPADELLGKLRQEPNVNGAEVIPLGFHVDYWDHQGWRDRFDSPAFTQRQQDYARQFHLDGPYTPQMVVNGELEFVGSSASRAAEAIHDLGLEPAAARVVLSSQDKGELAIQVNGASHGDVMLAVTEDNLETKVGAGENGGRMLHHSAVVRDFRNVGQIRNGSFAATVPLKLSNDWKRNDLRVLVFIEDPASGRIAGAASMALHSSVAPH